MSKQAQLSAVKSALAALDWYFDDDFGVLEDGPANEAYTTLEEKRDRLEREIEEES